MQDVMPNCIIHTIEEFDATLQRNMMISKMREVDPQAIDYGLKMIFIFPRTK